MNATARVRCQQPERGRHTSSTLVLRQRHEGSGLIRKRSLAASLILVLVTKATDREDLVACEVLTQRWVLILALTVRPT